MAIFASMAGPLSKTSFATMELKGPPLSMHHRVTLMVKCLHHSGCNQAWRTCRSFGLNPVTIQRSLVLVQADKLVLSQNQAAINFTELSSNIFEMMHWMPQTFSTTSLVRKLRCDSTNLAAQLVGQ